MSAGIEDFGRWLRDLVRGGTAAARNQPWAWWDSAAARLVDAQLPGLADRVRAMPSVVATREDWADELLAEAGRWWTATRAWQEWDRLDEGTRGDLRVYLGWAQAGDDVRAGDPEAATPGRWQVLGAHRSEQGRLQQQRTWLREQASGETVCVLDFAAGGAVLPVPHLVGTVLDVPVARYPGSPPQRALFAQPPHPAAHQVPLPRGGNVADALADLAEACRRNPWTARVPVVVRGALVGPADGEVGELVDEQGVSLPLLPDDPVTAWDLLAVTGGHVTDVFGELEDQGFRPLAATEVDR